MKQDRRPDTLWLAILVVYAVYAGLFIYRTSFTVGGTRYFTLFDDAMISMTYARNLAHGHGLVWNPGGERVQGYTNLLWTLYMGLLHLVPVAKSKMSLLVQVSSAVLLMVNLFVVRKLAGAVSGGSRFVSLGAVTLTAFYLPLNSWSLQGMEVGLLTLLVSLALWRALEALHDQVFSAWPYVMLAVAVLVRLDMAVLFLTILGFMVSADPRARSKHLAVGLGLLGSALAVQLVFSRVYYGDFLPNTYYQKLVGYPFGWRVAKGLYAALVFIWRMNWVFFVVPVGLVLSRRRKSELLLAAGFLAQLAYSIYVGGDAWESWGGANRYVCIVMPAFFILFFAGARALGGSVKAYADRCLTRAQPGSVDKRLARAGVVLVFLSLANLNAIYGPAALTEMTLFKRTLHVEDNQKMVERALVIDRVTTGRATVAVVWDGAIPYFAERPAVSILGKNDRRIAHERMRTASGAKQIAAFYPGHLKWDYAYSIGTLKPDVVVHLWQDPESARPYLEGDYVQVKIDGFTLYLRSGSPNILWPKVKASSSG
jgi:arabinofuranosyltransferase